MKRIAQVAPTLAILIGISTGPQLQAQQPAPALVVSVGSFNHLGEGLEALAAGVGPDLAELLAMAPTELPGVDGTKPAGLLVTVGEPIAAPPVPGAIRLPFPVIDIPLLTFLVKATSNLQALAFLPVNDLDKLLAALEGMKSDGAKLSERDADGVYKFEYDVHYYGMKPLAVIFAQQKGDWLFLANSRDALDAAPIDPIALLDGLNQHYPLAVKLAPPNVPKSIREMIMDLISSDMPQDSKQRVAELLYETDSLTFGLAIDTQTPALNLDITLETLAGTPLADHLAAQADAATDFAGFFLSDAAVSLRASGQINSADAEQFQAMIDAFSFAPEVQNLNQAESDLTKQIVGDLFDVVSACIDGKQIDFAASVTADADCVVLFAAGHVTEAAKLEGVLKQRAALAPEGNQIGERVISLDAEEYKGVRMYMATVPKEAMDAPDTPPAFVGKTVSAVVGVSDDAVYLAAGIDPMHVLKAAIDASQAAAGQPTSPSQMTLSVSQIGQLVKNLAPADQLESAAVILDVLSEAAPADHVTFQTEVIPNGQNTQITVEAGVLSAIFAAATTAREAASDVSGDLEEVESIDADSFKWRVWTDNTGGSSVRAKYVKAAAGVVTLEKEDGSEITLPIDRLSERDQEWIKKPHTREE